VPTLQLSRQGDRDLAPVIGRPRQQHQLNILGMDALAAAVHLGASVRISASSPKLQLVSVRLRGRNDARSVR